LTGRVLTFYRPSETMASERRACRARKAAAWIVLGFSLTANVVLGIKLRAARRMPVGVRVQVQP
jgi:hypothetical protein